MKKFHLTCSGISQGTYKDLCKKDCQVSWFCIRCCPVARNLLKGMSDLSAKYDQLQSGHEKLLERVEALESRPSPSIAGGGGSATSIDEIVQKSVSTTINEIQELEYRKKNLVVFGVPEPVPGALGSDKDFISGIVATIGADNACIKDCMRLGKAREPGASPRLIRVTVSSVDDKMDILRKAKLLRERGHPKVYIKPDLTRRQLAAEKELVAALKLANANGRVMRIRRGKLEPLNPQGPQGAAGSG
jgi:hypothetical protein